MSRKILVLHGDRQTGDLFLGRIATLCKKLQKLGIDLEAPDGTFEWVPIPGVHNITSNIDSESDRNARISKQSQELMRTWWLREGNVYHGLDQTLSRLHDVWNQGNFEGILGFSQGARLTYLISLIHELLGDRSPFHGLKYVILASGYGDVPLPTNLWDAAAAQFQCLHHEKHIHHIDIPSLHIMGVQDKLIPVHSSRKLASLYHNPSIHEFEGGHHVPMRSKDVLVMIEFIRSFSSQDQSPLIIQQHPVEKNEPSQQCMIKLQPDSEHAQTQIDEMISLSFIFPDEFKLISSTSESNDGMCNYDHPIIYSIQLRPSDLDSETANLWPPKDIALRVDYTPLYPDELPKFSIQHDMNLLELRLSIVDHCLAILHSKAESELGMPCVMSCYYALKEFFECGGLLRDMIHMEPGTANKVKDGNGNNSTDQNMGPSLPMSSSSSLSPVSEERLKECTLQGLDIAYGILGRRKVHQLQTSTHTMDSVSEHSDTNDSPSNGKGGYWQYTIGLLGKPSAGKSTFFNTATAFARQRGGASSGTEVIDQDGFIMLGGASMAPHPFTTINPNIGYCLVPAPFGSCPEDNKDALAASGLTIGSTHGRSSNGQRLLPIMLKDVAGLVPQAYQGRGKGNKFLDDLTDADVLIHVVDVSGIADAEGNIIGLIDENSNDQPRKGAGSNPLYDLSWIQNELIQWVANNVESKWDTIVRRGRNKLVAMFSGYKQSQSFVWDVIAAVESFLHEAEGKVEVFNNLGEWNAGDLRRLVAAFLGARFPMALALNKCDLPSAAENIQSIEESLPIYGAHVGIPMSCLREMKYVRHHMIQSSNQELPHSEVDETETSKPDGVWLCLQSALCLREPVLVFPVNDMTTYLPLSGFNNNAINDPSLPSPGMIDCLVAAGGSTPSNWDMHRQIYSLLSDKAALRDVLVMKPGSSVEDVFKALKWMGAIGGEFVRAEAAGMIGEKAKLVKKSDAMGMHNRIIKIMTTKRREWQKK